MAAAGQKADQNKEPGQADGAPQATSPSGPEQVQFSLPPLPPLPSLSDLPPITIEPKRLLWLGGLAALGIAGIVEWPVVAAIGVGSYVAERFARESKAQKDR